MSADVTDPVEELLAAALVGARTDDRWALAASPQALTRVRRAATRQRARSAGLAVVGLTAVTSGATFALAALGHGGPDGAVVVPGNPGGATTAPSPVSGISPAWAPTSGRDWVLDKGAYDDFVATHTLPSDAPHNVQSPAPLTAYSARLEDDVRKGLPMGSALARQDAVDGQPGTAAIHALLVDGTPVEVARIPLQQPITSMYGGDAGPAITVRRDLPNGSVLLTIEHSGYGWGPGIPEGANTAIVITRNGEETTWNAPVAVPLDTVARWAQVAAGT
jgi:hypothetical protein